MSYVVESIRRAWSDMTDWRKVRRLWGEEPLFKRAVVTALISPAPLYVVLGLFVYLQDWFVVTLCAWLAGLHMGVAFGYTLIHDLADQARGGRAHRVGGETGVGDEPNVRASIWKAVHRLGMAWCGWAWRHLQRARGTYEDTE